MKTLELCIPVFNEASIIQESLTRVRAVVQGLPRVRIMITVVSNGSTDDTVSRIEALRFPEVVVCSLPERGKGRAVIHAARNSSADIFCYLDADLSADPLHVSDLLSAIEGGADVAIGSRRLKESQTHRSLWRGATAGLFHWYAEWLVPTGVSDSQCGMKMMNRKGRDILASCEDTGWFFDREFLGKCRVRGLSVVECPVRWEEFRFPGRKSKLRVVAEGFRSMVTLTAIRARVRRF